MNCTVKLNKDEKDLLFEIARGKKYIASGAEGSCYINKDELGRIEVLKIMDQTEPSHKLNEVILDSWYNLTSFAFPKKVFVEDGYIVAYTCRFYNDFLKPNSDGVPFIVCSDLLKNGISRFLDDLVKLSELGIHINDLDCNLVFDNYNLVAIDTLGYEYKDYNTFEENLKIFKNALKETFKYEAQVILDHPIDFDSEVDRILDIKEIEHNQKTFIR